jgi:hypothetical protein
MRNGIGSLALRNLIPAFFPPINIIEQDHLLKVHFPALPDGQVFQSTVLCQSYATAQ